MKKAILLIAALLMVGSLAFAETSFGIWGRTVFTLAASSNATGATVDQSWGPNWGAEGPRMGLHATFSNDKIEYKFTFYFNGAFVSDALNPARGADIYGTPADTTDDPIIDLDPNGNLDMVNMYGTLKLIPDLLSVMVGRMDGDGFDTFRKTSPNPNSDVNNDNIGRMNGWGVIIAVSPKDSGFDAALQIKTPTPNEDSYNIANQIYNLNVAASYALPSLLKFTLGFVNQATYDGTANTDYNIFARIELLAVENLTLWVDGRVHGIETNAIAMKYVLGAGYKMDALGIYLGAYFAIPASPATNLSYGANLEGQYDLGDVTPGIILTISDGDTSVAGIAFSVQPYVNLDDFGTRIAFELTYDTAGAGTLTWAVPVYFTFSIW